MARPCSNNEDERRPLLDKKTLDDEHFSYWTEFGALARLVVPIWFTNCFEFSQGAFATIIMGRLGTKELAAMGIAVESN